MLHLPHVSARIKRPRGDKLIARTDRQLHVERPALRANVLRHCKCEKSNRLNLNSYASMGFSLFVANKHKQGVKYFEKAIATGNAFALDHYNLACGYAILGEKDRAFVELEKAAAMGFKSRDQVVNDPDLNSLRSDKRYDVLIAKLE